MTGSKRVGAVHALRFACSSIAFICDFLSNPRPASMPTEQSCRNHVLGR